MLILPTILVAALAFALYGAVFAPALDVHPGLAGLALVVSKGIAIVAATVTIAAFGRGRAQLEYVGHFSLALFSGSLVLVPFCLMAVLAPTGLTATLGITAGLAAVAVVCWKLMRRTRAAGLKPLVVWTAALAWAVAFFAALAVAIYAPAGA
jgi:hypothetical protein